MGSSVVRDVDGGWADPVRWSAAGGRPRAGWWTMDADGSRAGPPHLGRRDRRGRRRFESTTVRLAADRWRGARATAMDAGDRRSRSDRRAPTPAPTPTPDLAPGFALDRLDGRRRMARPLGDTATPLADGRVLVTARLQHGRRAVRPGDRHVQPDRLDMTVVRGGQTATLLRDGRVLFAGGYNCAAGRPGRDLGVGRAVRPGDRARFSPTGSMRHASQSPHGDAAGRRSRPHRRRHTAPSPSAGTGSPSPRTDWSSRRGQLPDDRRDLRPGHGHVQQDRLDEHLPTRPHGDPAPGRPRPRRRQRRREQRQPARPPTSTTRRPANGAGPAR